MSDIVIEPIPHSTTSSAQSRVFAKPSATDLVDALNGVFGKHAQTRASHAKGIGVSGYFQPSPAASTVVKGAFWKQPTLPLVGRFSVGGGNPQASDKGQTVRGLALHIGGEWDLVSISAPVFMVATPAEFIAFMAARKPDPATGKPDPARVKAFNEATPSAQPQINYLANTPVPASYAQSNYWAINAFVFNSARQQQNYGRWILEPKAGVAGLTPEQLAQKNDHFLLPELTERLVQGPVEFELWLQLAKPGDNIINPTVQWPVTNPKVCMGKIVIKALDDSCATRMFNPANLPEGITLSEDPTLQARSSSYIVSVQRRTEQS